MELEMGRCVTNHSPFGVRVALLPLWVVFAHSMRVGMPVPPKAVVELRALHKGLSVSGWHSHLLPTPSRLSSRRELLFRGFQSARGFPLRQGIVGLHRA
jgi:hypothetical protein